MIYFDKNLQKLVIPITFNKNITTIVILENINKKFFFLLFFFIDPLN